ncbi:E3 ubiquitin protein ligase UPL7 [Tanacetum coccineum]
MLGRSGNSNWTIEDDFRLRKAAKGGVSFEQLAKGEVQFSEKYTIKELHDRWHAILYDPVVSAELLSGGNHDIDVDDLRSTTKYTGGYTEGSRTVKLFWEVLREFEPKERCLLMKFVTSCSRAPLLGFKHLKPSFTIHKVACDIPLWAKFGGQDVDRLPSGSTCYNTLKLPTYKRVSTLRTKLLYAINSNAGFELS